MEHESGTDFQHVHPKEKVSRISHLFFCWQLPIMFKRQITESNLYSPLQEHESQLLGTKLESAWLKETQMFSSNASLRTVLLKVFGLEFALYGLILIPCEIGLGISLPLILGKLLNCYSNKKGEVVIHEMYWYTVFLIVGVFLRSICMHFYWFGMEHLGMKIRVACSSVIYRKCLKLNQETLAGISVGQIVNLLGTDVVTFNCGLIRYVHYVWFAPIFGIVVFYVLYQLLGITTLIGMVILIAFIPFEMFLCKRISIYRSKVAQSTDRRVRLTKEVIEGIKIIKMLTWEKPLIELIGSFRKSEMGNLKSSLYPYALSFSFSTFLYKCSIFFCVSAYVMLNHSVNAQYIFVIIGIYETVKLSVGVFLIWGTTCLGEIITTIKRIESFLKSTQLKHSYRTTSSKDINIRNICVKYDKTADAEYILNEITLTVKSNDLIALVGSVGCGKSTLLKVILEEITLDTGSVEIGGTISYAGQEPWLFGGTIRDNILFGETYNEDKYMEILKVCALESDLQSFPRGDMTFVGDRGTMLSGGQKARVNLARSVYRDADFYLLDDPLSAVDANVAKFIFQNCIKNYLDGKGIVLVTHQLQFLPEVDRIYLVEKGKSAIAVTYQDLQNSEYLCSKQENRNGKQNTEKETSQKTSSDILTTSAGARQSVEHTEALGRLFIKYFKANGTSVLPLMIILLSLLLYTAVVGTDYFLAVWVNLEEQKSNTYNYFLYVYTACIVGTIVLSLSFSITMVQFFIKTSANLHSKMVNKIIHAPTDFFNNNPSGRILNRFSFDIGLVDRNIPLAMTDTISVGGTIIASMIFLSIVNYWTLLLALPLIIVFYFFQKTYLNTSRILKHTEAKSRSPIFSHLTTTLQGSSTTRALRSECYQKDIFEKYQNIHTSSCYMFLACNSAFGFWVDFCSIVYFGIIISLTLFFIDTEMPPGNIGLVITRLWSLIGMVQYGIKQSAEIENQMVAVERIIGYSEVETESMAEGKLVKEWPLHGKLEFQSVSFRYHPESPLVLKQVTFMVQPGQKIGIVGRTGAGKSSLTSVLFRLFQFEGDVLIDDTDIKTVPLQTLRSKISIIPQEPLLFSSSLRTNLDPCDEYQDSQIWDALGDVELKEVISELPAGLSTKLTEGGLNFSVGQRQLVCLARAILKMNKILVLDEATANVDLKTDEMIQSAVNTKFGDCTILIIAHRLHTVMECDKILVMDSGQVVEFDTPAALLQNDKGRLFQLVNCGRNG